MSVYPVFQGSIGASLSLQKFRVRIQSFPFLFLSFFARWGLLRLDGDLREQNETGARAGRRSGLQKVETLVDFKLSGETERGEVWF